jgi:hypothetical protein
VAGVSWAPRLSIALVLPNIDRLFLAIPILGILRPLPINAHPLPVLNSKAGWPSMDGSLLFFSGLRTVFRIFQVWFIIFLWFFFRFSVLFFFSFFYKI